MEILTTDKSLVDKFLHDVGESGFCLEQTNGVWEINTKFLKPTDRHGFEYWFLHTYSKNNVGKTMWRV